MEYKEQSERSRNSTTKGGEIRMLVRFVPEQFTKRELESQMQIDGQREREEITKILGKMNRSIGTSKEEAKRVDTGDFMKKDSIVALQQEE